MRKILLAILVSLASIAMNAQTLSDQLRKDVEALERSAAKLLDSVSVVKFDVSYIGDELWVNDFAQYNNGQSAGTWSDSMTWMLPEGIVDGKDNIESDEESIHIDLFGRTDLSFATLVQRFKAHGFTHDANEETTMGVHMYEARNVAGDRQCSVLDMGRGHLQISIEKCQSDEDYMKSMLEKAGVTDVEKMMKMINQ